MFKQDSAHTLKWAYINTKTHTPFCVSAGFCRMQCLPTRSDGDDSLLSSRSEVRLGEGVTLQAVDGRTWCFVTIRVRLGDWVCLASEVCMCVWLYACDCIWMCMLVIFCSRPPVCWEMCVCEGVCIMTVQWDVHSCRSLLLACVPRWLLWTLFHFIDIFPRVVLLNKKSVYACISKHPLSVSTWNVNTTVVLKLLAAKLMILFKRFVFSLQHASECILNKCRMHFFIVVYLQLNMSLTLTHKSAGLLWSILNPCKTTK